MIQMKEALREGLNGQQRTLWNVVVYASALMNRVIHDKVNIEHVLTYIEDSETSTYSYSSQTHHNFTDARMRYRRFSNRGPTIRVEVWSLPQEEFPMLDSLLTGVRRAILSVLLAALIASTLAACNDGPPASTNTPAPTDTPTPSAIPTPTSAMVTPSLDREHRRCDRWRVR